MKRFVVITFLFILILGCERDDDLIGTYYRHEIKKWNEYVGSMEGYDFRYMVDFSGIAAKDTIFCSALKDGKPWFALYKKSDHSKILEWSDIVDLDTSKVYIWDHGYGNKDEIRIQSVAPVFYKFYGDLEVVELTFGQMTLDHLLWGPNEWNEDLGIGLIASMIGGGGYYPSMQQVIFINKTERVAREVTFSDSYNGLPTHIIDGYKESVFIDNQCLSMNKVLFEKIDDFGGVDDISCFFTSYSEIVSVFKDEAWKYCIDKNNEQTMWWTTISPPFEIPEGSDPIVDSRVLSHNESTATCLVSMVYYDGTKKSFKYTINLETGAYTIIE